MVINLYLLCALKITLDFLQKWNQQGIKNQERTLLRQSFFLFITVIFQKTTYSICWRYMSTKGFHQKLHVFEHFHFGLGGSKEPSEPPLDPPQDQRAGPS